MLVFACSRVLGAFGQHDGDDGIGFVLQPADGYFVGFDLLLMSRSAFNLRNRALLCYVLRCMLDVCKLQGPWLPYLA